MIAIIAAESKHVPALAELAEDMDRFYGATETVPMELRVRQIKDALFTDAPSAYSLLAWDEGKLVGFASYSFLWPAVGLTRSLYLKELYIMSAVRRKGVGKLLMETLYQVAVENHCSRVEWTTDIDNREAQLFYSELGVPVKESKLFYRVEGDELGRRADSLNRLNAP